MDVASKSVKMKQVRVYVQKTPMMKIPIVVWEHEVELLRESHGEENIRVDAIREVAAPKDFNIIDEYARLGNKYNVKGDIVVSRIFPKPSDLANALKLPMPSKGVADEQQGIAINREMDGFTAVAA